MPNAEPRQRLQDLGLAVGPVAALLVGLVLPESYAGADGETVAFSFAGRATAAVAVWMAIWWLTEAIAIYATALLPLALFPLLGARSMREAASPYAHELIFLFMGGFLLALAMERWARARGEDVSPDEVLVVGDTPRDVDCARANGCACLAVATGHYSAEQLRDAGATVVVDHLDDPSPFWDLVAR